MASWQQQIQARLGSALGGGSPIPTTTEVEYYVEDAIQETRIRLMRAVPQDIPQFCKVTTVTNDNGVDVEEALSIVSVTREDGAADLNDIPCTEVSPEMKYKVTDTDSLWYRSKHNPCYFWEKEKIYIKPAPASGENTGRVTYVPSCITQGGGSSISIGSATTNTDAFPNKYLHLVVWHTMVQTLQTTMNNIHTEINSLISNIVVPDVPNIIHDKLEMPSLPNYNPTPITLDFNSVDAYFGSEDAELVAPAINKVTQQISEYNALTKDEQQRVQTKLKEYDGELQKRFKQADGELQAEINQYQRRIEKYGQDIAKYGADLQSWTARYNWYAGQAQMYSQQYLAFFGHVAPPQQKKQESEGRNE